MDASRRPSIQELTAESERTRAELAQTIAALRSNVGDATANIQTTFSPTHLKNEAKGWIRDRGDDLYQSFEQKVRQNPLQAAAAGAAIAYPLWGLFRLLPPPFLLIAAGFWLSKGRRPAAPTTEGVVARYRHDVEQDLADSPSIVSDLTDQLGQAVQQTAEAAKGKIGKIYSAARDQVSDTASQTSDMLSQTSESAAETLRTTRAQASQASERARQTVTDFVRENPLITAGIGLAIGAVIATALPATQPEKRAVSPLRRRAKDAAAGTIDYAQDMVSDTVRRASEAAQRAGLTTDDLGQKADALAGKVRAVAERGLQAAAGGDKQNEKLPSEISGANHE